MESAARTGVKTMNRNLAKLPVLRGGAGPGRIAGEATAEEAIAGSGPGISGSPSAVPMWAPDGAISPSDQEALSSPAASDDAQLVDFAEALYRSRQRRAHFFPQELLGEPGWDLLLDLFIQHSRGHLISTTSACIASGVPPTTALRWISVLEARGLVARTKAHGDHRVNNIALTGLGADMVREYLADVWHTFWQ